MEPCKIVPHYDQAFIALYFSKMCVLLVREEKTLLTTLKFMLQENVPSCVECMDKRMCIRLTGQLPVLARVTATEFKEFSQQKYLIQTIVKIMHKRMRFKSLRLNRC